MEGEMQVEVCVGAGPSRCERTTASDRAFAPRSLAARPQSDRGREKLLQDITYAKTRWKGPHEIAAQRQGQPGVGTLAPLTLLKRDTGTRATARVATGRTAAVERVASMVADCWLREGSGCKEKCVAKRWRSRFLFFAGAARAGCAASPPVTCRVTPPSRVPYCNRSHTIRDNKKHTLVVCARWGRTPVGRPMADDPRQMRPHTHARPRGKRHNNTTNRKKMIL